MDEYARATEPPAATPDGRNRAAIWRSAGGGCAAWHSCAGSRADSNESCAAPRATPAARAVHFAPPPRGRRVHEVQTGCSRSTLPITRCSGSGGTARRRVRGKLRLPQASARRRRTWDGATHCDGLNLDPPPQLPGRSRAQRAVASEFCGGAERLVRGAHSSGGVALSPPAATPARGLPQRDRGYSLLVLRSAARWSTCV